MFVVIAEIWARIYAWLWFRLRPSTCRILSLFEHIWTILGIMVYYDVSEICTSMVGSRGFAKAWTIAWNWWPEGLSHRNHQKSRSASLIQCHTCSWILMNLQYIYIYGIWDINSMDVHNTMWFFRSGAPDQRWSVCCQMFVEYRLT